MLSQNEVLTDVMTRAATMELPGWYVTAGCPFQTAWNVVTDRPPTSGIKDYDIYYFDGTDLSWVSAYGLWCSLRRTIRDRVDPAVSRSTYG